MSVSLSQSNNYVLLVCVISSGIPCLLCTTFDHFTSFNVLSNCHIKGLLELIFKYNAFDHKIMHLQLSMHLHQTYSFNFHLGEKLRILMQVLNADLL